jgi:hypothetical protein
MDNPADDLTQDIATSNSLADLAATDAASAQQGPGKVLAFTAAPRNARRNFITHLDDPRHDVCARQVHLARHLAVRVHGKELNDLIDSVDEACAELAAMPEAAGDLAGITYALMGAELFLRKLADAFDNADAEVRA